MFFSLELSQVKFNGKISDPSFSIVHSQTQPSLSIGRENVDRE
jgi:hypothetical protein